MAKPRIRDLDETAQAAAFLRARSRWSQDAIAKTLNVSQAGVSRLLAHARKKGWLEEVAQFVRTPDIGDDRMARFEEYLGHSALAEALMQLGGRNTRLRAVRVFDSGGTDAEGADVQERQRRFGEAAAPWLAERLRDSQLIGVTWGSSVNAAIAAIARLGYPWRSDTLRQVVPVSAEPMQFAHNEYTSSTLARHLHEIVNASHDKRTVKNTAKALTGVPAFIPQDLSRMIPGTEQLVKEMGDELPKLFRKFFETNSPAYGEIFVGPDALIRRVDMLITSVGISEKPMGFCKDDLLTFGGLDEEQIKRLVVGDVGGVLLPKPDSKPEEIKTVDRLNAMWTGIQHRHLEAIAQRAKSQRRPGVVVLAFGASRRAVIREALMRGLCSELVIDRDLAAGLSADLGIVERSSRD
jgi:DNA-binding transcriptional regulator LsrR (DeoR family)